MAVTPLKPATFTGVAEFFISVLPSWPYSLSPQAHTDPSLPAASEKWSPRRDVAYAAHPPVP